MASAILLACLLLGSGAAPQVEDPVAAEWRVRQAALTSLEQAGLAQPGADWRQRFRALDALNRRLAGRITPSEVQLAKRLLFDEQPNVRGLALAVHARHGLAVPASVERLLRDPLPQVRLELARALVHGESALATQWLTQLALDGDRRVAREACAQLFSMGEIALEEQRDFLVQHWSTLAPELFLNLLDVIDHSNGSAALIEVMEPVLHAPPSSMGTGHAFEARRALWATLAGTAPAVEFAPLLVEQWLLPLDMAGSTVEHARRKRLERLRAPAPFKQKLVEELLDRAEELDALAQSGGEDAVDAQWQAHELVVAAAQVHFAAPAQDPDWRPGQSWRSPGVFPMRDGWSAALAEEAWSACFGRADSWDESLLLGLAHPSEAVRFAAWDTLAEIWGRTGGLDPQLWLAGVLQDDLLAPAIYRSFLHAERSLPNGVALHDWWARQERGEQLELLREHGTQRTYLPWRAELIEFWGSGTGRTRTVLELLARFSGDDEVARLLMPALVEQLVVLEADSVPPKEVTRGAWREAEARATWMLEAWLGARNRDEPGVAERVQLLLRVGKLGKELGKALVSDLARTPQGLDGLASVVGSPELSSRVRYEILLNHDGLQDTAQIDELFTAYASCDEELRLRILKRGGELGSPLARALLLQVALDRKEGPAPRQQALASLRVQQPETLAVELLARVLNEVEDYELKQAAVEGLGEIARDHGSLKLLELHDDSFERSLMGDELLAAMVSIEVRSQTSLSAQVEERWRSKASEGAAAELAERFVSRRLPARNFVYAGWLQAAGSLARAGWLEQAMGAEWWTWDGRLLMRLAEVAAEHSRPEFVGRIQEAARVALLGEGPAGERPGLLVRLRARRMLIALAAEDWAGASAQVGVLLDGWRAGRISDLAIESVFGPAAPGLRDPRASLLAIEIECDVRLALARGDTPTVARLVPRVRELSRSPSRMARARLAQLLADLPAEQLRRSDSTR